MLELIKEIAKSILKKEIDEYVSIISDYAAQIVIEKEKVKELNSQIEKLTYTSEL